MLHRNRRTWMLKLALTLVACFALACGPLPEDEAPLAEEPARKEQSNSGQCEILSAAAGASAGAAVVLLEVTGACAFGTAVTTAGTTTPVCLIPLTAEAFFLLATVTTTVGVYLTCEQPQSLNLPFTMPQTGIKVFFAQVKYRRAQCQCSGAASCSGTIDIPMISSSHDECTKMTKIACSYCGSCSSRALGCDHRNARPDNIPQGYQTVLPAPRPGVCNSSTCAITLQSSSGSTMRRANCSGKDGTARASEKLAGLNGEGCFQCVSNVGWMNASGCIQSTPTPPGTPQPTGTPTP